MKIKNYVLSFLAFGVVLTSNGFASRSTDNTHTMGKSASNKEIIFNRGAGANNPRLMWNEATSEIGFKNVGSNPFQALGAGGSDVGGIGFNLLTSSDNYGFESGTGQWASSGGSWTTTATAPFYGTTSGLFDASALNQTLSSNAKTINEGLKGKNCQAGFSYSFTGSNGDYIAEIFDGTIVVASTSLTVSSTPSDVKLDFVCPSSGTILLRVKAGVANPSVIKLDGHSRVQGYVYLGSATGLTSGSATGVYSEVTVYDYSYPSCGSLFMTYATVLVNTGSDLLYTQDAVNGDSITILTDGVYMFNAWHGYLATAQFSIIDKGYAVGACDMTAPLSVPVAQVLAIGAATAVNAQAPLIGSAFLTAGTVLHVRGTGNGLDANVVHTHRWSVVKVSN